MQRAPHRPTTRLICRSDARSSNHHRRRLLLRRLIKTIGFERGIDTLLWQLIASVATPGYTIHTVVAAANWALARAEESSQVRQQNACLALRDASSCCNLLAWTLVRAEESSQVGMGRRLLC